jgi:Putative auto-transporter adhesin, head GIN domain
MKKLFVFASVCCALALAMMSCIEDRVFGSGSILTEKRTITTPFKEIRIKNSMDVTIKQGDSLSVEVKDYGNLLPYITTRVSGNTLIIDSDAWIRHSVGVVMITLPTLTGVEVDGSGNISTVGNFTFNDLSLIVDGSSNFSLAGSCKTLTAKIYGSGSIHAFDMPTETANVSVSGSGALKLNVLRTLDVAISGSGDVMYKGDPSVTSRITGSGRVYKY